MSFFIVRAFLRKIDSETFPKRAQGNELLFAVQYMKKLHMQERAVEEVKLAIKPFYQKREITKEEYKNIVRKAVQKVSDSEMKMRSLADHEISGSTFDCTYHLQQLHAITEQQIFGLWLILCSLVVKQ